MTFLREANMETNLLIKKYVAWMILYSESGPLSLLELQKTYDGKTSLSSYIPLINSTLCITHENIKTAFDSFFETFEQTIQFYVKDKPDIKDAFEKQVAKTNLKKIYKKIKEDKERSLEILNALEKDLVEEGEIGEE